MDRETFINTLLMMGYTPYKVEGHEYYDWNHRPDNQCDHYVRVYGVVADVINDCATKDNCPAVQTERFDKALEIIKEWHYGHS